MLPRCFQDASKLFQASGHNAKFKEEIAYLQKGIQVSIEVSGEWPRSLPVPMRSYELQRIEAPLGTTLIRAGRIQMNSETLDYLDFHLEIMMDHDGPCIKWDSRALMIFCSTTSPRISESVLCIKLLYSMYIDSIALRYPFTFVYTVQTYSYTVLLLVIIITELYIHRDIMIYIYVWTIHVHVDKMLAMFWQLAKLYRQCETFNVWTLSLQVSQWFQPLRRESHTRFQAKRLSGSVFSRKKRFRFATSAQCSWRVHSRKQ